MTSNHDPGNRYERPAGALLAGVCAGLAARLGWNTWAIRALFVLGLFINAIGAGVLYLLLALVMPRLGSRDEAGPELKADELSERQRRIADLERRFREMERGNGG